MSMLQEFKEFAVKGNAMDLAVGVIVGGAFGKIVDSIVGDLIMPLVGRLIGNLDFSNLFVVLGNNPNNLTTLAELKKAGIGVFAYGNFLTVALKIRSDDLFPDNWIYIHDSKVQVGRIQNFRSWSPEMVPDSGVACVGLEYFCFEGDGLWSMADDDLVELAKREMQTLGLVDPAQVIGGAVVRQEKAYPVYDDEYAANVDAMRTELEAAHPTLHLVGRNGMHRYNNQDHAMMTAMLTVENILAEARVYDIWCVNEDAEYHEAGDEGAEQVLPAAKAAVGKAVSADQAAALGSVRDVPERVAPAAAKQQAA